MRLDILERALCRFFSWHILFVLRHPLPFLLGPLVATALLSVGMLQLLDAMAKDELELYTPTDALARRELAQLDALFHINDSDPFYASRRYDLKRTGYIIITVDGREFEDEDILNPTALKAAAHLWSVIQTFTVDQPGQQPQHMDYPSLCVRFPVAESLDGYLSSLSKGVHNGSEQQQFCVSNPLLELFKVALQDSASVDELFASLSPNGGNGSLLSGHSSLGQLLSSVSLDSLGSGVRGLLGGVSLDPATRRIAGAKALMLPYALKHSTEEEDALAEKWELKLADFLLSFRSPFIKANWWTYETFAAESDRDRQSLRHLMLPCFLAVSLLSVLLCCTSSPVFSRPLLALSGVLSVAMAITSGVGLLLLLGHRLNSVVLSMPFIIFSVGVDNVFILLAAWRATPARLSLEERMERTFGDAGVSITITSLTDILSFAVGCMTPFPSVQTFCLFAATSLLFVYIYQLTVFAALMGLTSAREVQNRHCLTLRRKRIARRTVRSSGIDADPSADSFSHNLAMSRFFHSYFASVLLNKFVRVFVLSLFGLYLLISAYGCLNIELGLEPLDLLPEDSYGKEALRVAEKYFAEQGGHLHVWMHNLSSVKLGHRRLWLVLEKEIELFEHTEFTGPADSWLRAFLHFQHSHGVFTTHENFVPMIRQFLVLPRNRKYRRDVRFTSDGLSLDASRVPVRLRFVGFQNQSRAMLLFRRLAESSELPTSVYADFFLFAEQQNSLVPGTISSIGIAGLAVVLVSLLFIPEPMAALWVSFSIVSINLGVLGLMPFLSLRLDFLSMVTIVMSIGFCVDFSAHLAYNFARCKTMESAQRLRNALYSVGTPIIQSASSTILGVSFLASAESYIFRSFFKTIVLVVVLGVVHGLVILPILLTVVQSDGQNENERPLDEGGWRADKFDRSAKLAVPSIAAVTANQISAPIPTQPKFSCTVAYAHNPFGLILRRGDESSDSAAEESLYSKLSTLPIGSDPLRIVDRKELRKMPF